MAESVARLISKKRDGAELTDGEWRSVLGGFTEGSVPAYQVSALLMAVRFVGVTPNELNTITDCMIASGGALAFPPGPPVVDKHSTGGVGDKVSLVLAPLVSACGVRVPMMSGRGLGHTGGTLDKLESIPGFRTDLTMEQAQEQIAEIGCALIGQTNEIAPTDRKLYALRDVTGTVEIPPLIAASIMSKKLAEGLDALVLDVKQGSGAFLPDLQDGLELAQTMTALGEARGCRTSALITAMHQPLGRACGNALETEEAIATLRGEGPPDLVEVTMALGADMLVTTGVSSSVADARRSLATCLESGRAAERFGQIIEAQGGNPAVIDDPAVLPQAPVSEVYTARAGGRIMAMDTRAIGWGIVEMGGGRRTVEDEIDPGVGLVVTGSVGDDVEPGAPLATIYARDADGLGLGRQVLDAAIAIGDGEVEHVPLVSHRVSAAGVETLS